MKKLLIVLLAISSVCLYFIPVANAENTSSLIDQFVDSSSSVLQTVLQKEQLIFVDNAEPGKLQFITVMTLFNAPKEKVFSIITDYDDYAQHVPETTNVKIIKKEGNIWIVKYDVEVRFSILSQHANYTLKQTVDPPDSITWTRIAGNIDKIEGSWKLISIDNGKKTIGVYRVYDDISSLGFLVRYMLEKQPTIRTAISTSSALVYTQAIQKWVNETTKNAFAKKDKFNNK